MKYIYNKLSNKAIVIMLSIMVIALISLNTLINNFFITTFFLVALIGLFILLFMNFNMEKTIIAVFFITIPFFRDYADDRIYYQDYHMLTKPFYVFNMMQLFSLLFLFFIWKNRNKLKRNMSIILLGIFTIICFASSFYAVNFKASVFDAFRYLQILIIYIYFSQICDIKNLKGIITKSLIIGLTIQLIIGILQIIYDGPVGLGFIGESSTVFRVGMSGLEKGISGTLEHPGPLGLYACTVLGLILFDVNINKKIRLIGIVIATLTIILTFGRTTIMVMALLYIAYIFIITKNLTIKKILILFTSIFILVAIVGVFHKDVYSLISRFTDSDLQEQVQNRSQHVDLALYYIKQNPIFGSGLNNYLDLTYRDFPMQFYSNFFLKNPIHNEFLLYAVEIGILGVSVFIAIILNSFYNFYRLYKSYVNDKEKMIIIGYLFNVLYYIVYCFQGWGGLKTRSLIMFFISIAFINFYYKEKFSQLEDTYIDNINI